MDKKLNFTDLSDFFAKAVGVSAADAESFVHTFFDIIVEGLEKDGIVKINGLGTFKVVEVESRSSVNINTGERFEINGHKRLTFIPADSLKEIINAPFAMFEPVEVDDDIDEEEEEENDDKDTSIDTNTADEPVQEEFVEEESPAIEQIDTVAETLVTEENIVIEEKETVSVSDIEEEMPQEITEENNFAATVNIDEEMPIDESDYVPENIPAEINEEKIEAEKQSFSEEIVTEESETTTEEVVAIAPENENSNKTEPIEIAVPTKKETPKKEISIPEKKEEIFFHTLTRKKKKNRFSKVAIFFSIVIICSAFATIGLYLYDKTIFEKISIKKTIVAVEEIKTPETKVTENIVSTDIDSVAVASDSIINIIADTIETEKDTVISQKDSVAKDTVVPVIQLKEEKPAIKKEESFKIVESLASRDLSTIFVADTTDYRIIGTICTHKVKSEETLIRISLQYYGDKRLWPYIVKYNKMVRPNDLACDMMLKIPRLTPKK